MPKDELKELQESMDKAIDFLQNEYLSIRTGRAHPGLVSDIKLDYYGTSRSPTSPFRRAGRSRSPPSTGPASRPSRRPSWRLTSG